MELGLPKAMANDGVSMNPQNCLLWSVNPYNIIVYQIEPFPYPCSCGLVPNWNLPLVPVTPPPIIANVYRKPVSHRCKIMYIFHYNSISIWSYESYVCNCVRTYILLSLLNQPNDFGMLSAGELVTGVLVDNQRIILIPGHQWPPGTSILGLVFFGISIKQLKCCEFGRMADIKEFGAALNFVETYLKCQLLNLLIVNAGDISMFICDIYLDLSGSIWIYLATIYVGPLQLSKLQRGVAMPKEVGPKLTHETPGNKLNQRSAKL